MPVIVVSSKESTQTYTLTEGKPMFLGRAKECDIHLASPSVSRRHAVILFKNGICGVKDLGSFNGTQVNDQQIQAPYHLTENDIVRIASFVITLQPQTTVSLPDPSLIPIPAQRKSSSTTSILDHEGGSKLPRKDSRTLANSDIMIPRAMQGDETVDFMINEIRANSTRRLKTSEDTHSFQPGSDTVAFLRDIEKRDVENKEAEKTCELSETELRERLTDELVLKARSGQSGEGDDEKNAADGESGSAVIPVESLMPEVPTPPTLTPVPQDTEMVAVVEAERDAEVTDDDLSALASDSGTLPLGEFSEPAGPDDTNFFRETVEIAQRLGKTDSSGKDEKSEPEPASASAEAEELIPLLEPEVLPQLTLEKDPLDEATQIALEKLVSPEEMNDSVVLVNPPSMDTAVFAKAVEEHGDHGEGDAENGADSGEFDIAGDGDAHSPVSDVGSVTAIKGMRAERNLAGLEPIAISPALMAAINTRLSLYSLLFDLMEERKLLRMSNTSLSPKVLEELRRQDEELDCLPSSEEAERLMAALNERREKFTIAAREAQNAGMSQPDDVSPEMRAAEEMALSQWLLIRDSNHEALPAIFKEAYRLASDEPLARELTAVRISHGRLLGGAIYLLALENLADAAQSERRKIAARMRSLNEDGPENGKKSVLSKLGKIGKLANNLRNRTEIREEETKLLEKDRTSELRADLALREMAFMERLLILEFRKVYHYAAVHFIPQHETMPLAVRAFFRHGVVGFKPWWMRREVRDFITRDCQDNVITTFERGPHELNVVYVDEYLAAIAHMECSPSPDESLEGMDKSSEHWKTDRAYRRIVNSRSYNVLMEDMLATLEQRMKALDAEALALEERIADVKAQQFDTKDSMFNLQTEQQAVAIRRGNLAKHVKRIEKEVVASIIEAVQEAEGRFRKGELRMPEMKALIRREVDSLIGISRRLEGQRSYFMPMIVREQYQLNQDTLNDRGAVRSRLTEIERLDPGIFTSTIIPAKKRANRVELRISPTAIILPAYGLKCLCSMAREGMEGGHMVIPSCFAKPNIRGRQFSNMLADFRWETSRNLAGRDVMNSDTLVGTFMKIRWDWRNLTKAKREKGLIINEMNDAVNWRRVYELYLSDAMTGCRLLFARNPEMYAAILGRYIDLPDGVKILRQSSIE